MWTKLVVLFNTVSMTSGSGACALNDSYRWKVVIRNSYGKAHFTVLILCKIVTMAQCKQSAQEFIKSTFSPQVAVLCSNDAELLCQKNNLSFVQLVQPFCRLTTEGRTVVHLAISGLMKFC